MDVEKEFYGFLDTFEVDGARYYHKEVIIQYESAKYTLYVDIAHVRMFSNILLETISNDFSRVEPSLRKACENFFIKVCLDFFPDILEKNLRRATINVAFHKLSSVKRLRDITISELGKLVAFTGIVTHTGKIQSELLEAAFMCLDCSTISNVDQQHKYIEPTICSNAICQNRKRWNLLVEESKFAEFKSVSVQECSNEIPEGSSARSLQVILRHDTVDRAFLGNVIVCTGSLVERQVVRLTEYHQFFQYAFVASSVGSSVGREEGLKFTEKLIRIREIRETPDFFNKLLNSIAPEIDGHEEIKRVLLLMLIGGVQKITSEKINLRGNIHVCIVGDLACRKSQFLRCMKCLVPGCVQISGKSSSAAGLTGTVAREPETGEFGIQSSALMMAEVGICFIDQFDMMDKRVQASVREAMEHQSITITITKAGIQTTLNARAPILAAASPRGGHYDMNRPFKYNVADSEAILSSFDVVCVMVDEPDEGHDSHVLDHMVIEHQSQQEQLLTFTAAQVQEYVSSAKTVFPKLSSEASTMLERYYTYFLNRQADSTRGGQVAYRTPVRQLEAVIRISEAIARCHLDHEVKRCHVLVALDMLETTLFSRVKSLEADLSAYVDGNNRLVISEETHLRVTRTLLSILHREDNKTRGIYQRDLIKEYYTSQSYDNFGCFVEEATVEAIIEELMQEGCLLTVVPDPDKNARCFAIHPLTFNEY